LETLAGLSKFSSGHFQVGERFGQVGSVRIDGSLRLLGDSAQGMVSLPEMTSLDERVRLRLRTVERVGEELRVIARI